MTLDSSAYGNIVVQNVYGQGKHEIVCSGQAGVSSPYFYHQDHRGNVTGITDTKGTMQETVMYDPYGRPYIYNRAGTALSKSQFSNIFYMTGRPYTPLTGWNAGIYDMRARFYAVDFGRFMQCDPLGFKGGGNLYAYAGNNPMSRSDPFGLFFMDDSGDGGGDGGGFGGGDGGGYGGGDAGGYGGSDAGGYWGGDASGYGGYGSQTTSDNLGPGDVPGFTYDPSQEGSSSTIDTAFNEAFDLLGKLWNIPNDIIGVAAGIGLGIASIPFDIATGTIPTIGFGNNAIQFGTFPFFGGAITFGNVQLYFGSDTPSSLSGHIGGMHSTFLPRFGISLAEFTRKHTLTSRKCLGRSSYRLTCSTTE